MVCNGSEKGKHNSLPHTGLNIVLSQRWCILYLPVPNRAHKCSISKCNKCIKLACLKLIQCVARSSPKSSVNRKSAADYPGFIRKAKA